MLDGVTLASRSRPGLVASCATELSTLCAHASRVSVIYFLEEVTPGAEMPGVPGFQKQDYAVLFVVGLEKSMTD
eukprot:661236-Prorocentrum_minimum.AAC.1